MKVFYIKVHGPFTVCSEEEWVKRQYRERWLPRQTKALGHESALCLLTGKSIRWSHEDEIPVIFFPVDDRSVSKQNFISNSLLKYLEEQKPDVIVWKGLGYQLSSWVYENLSYHPKIVFIVGGKTEDKYLSKASAILAETEEQANTCFKSFVEQDRCWVLPKSLDTDVFKPNENKEFDIINVGSFEERKNQKIIIPYGKKYKIALVGDGPLKSKLIQMAKDINVLNNVHFLGNQSTEKVAELISKSKILFHTSIWEGFARCIIEALSCGIPIIANKNVIKDLINSGEHGLLVDEINYEKAIDCLLTFPEIRRIMGNNGRKLVLSKYCKDSTISVLQNMFEILKEGLE